MNTVVLELVETMRLFNNNNKVHRKIETHQTINGVNKKKKSGNSFCCIVGVVRSVPRHRGHCNGCAKF